VSIKDEIILIIWCGSMHLRPQLSLEEHALIIISYVITFESSDYEGAERHNSLIRTLFC
jgi:type IV secretory pathway VirB2 component (pilin)